MTVPKLVGRAGRRYRRVHVVNPKRTDVAIFVKSPPQTSAVSSYA